MSGSLFLERAELVKVTGRKWRKHQIAWLAEHGWRFTVSGLGEVIVARGEFDRQLVSGKPTQPESAIRWGEVKDGRKAA